MYVSMEVGRLLFGLLDVVERVKLDWRYLVYILAVLLTSLLYTHSISLAETRQRCIFCLGGIE